MIVRTSAAARGEGPIAHLGMLRRAFDAKFWGHVTTVRAALPYLAPAGSITLLGAIAARAAMPGTAGTAAINGAVEALVKPLASSITGPPPRVAARPVPLASILPYAVRLAFTCLAARPRTGCGDLWGSCSARALPVPRGFPLFPRCHR